MREAGWNGENWAPRGLFPGPRFGCRVQGLPAFHRIPCSNGLCYEAVFLTGTVSQWRWGENPGSERRHRCSRWAVIMEGSEIEIVSKKKKPQEGQIPRTRAKASTLSIRGQRSICKEAPCCSVFLSKDWKGARLSKVFAFPVLSSFLEGGRPLPSLSSLLF